MNDTDIVSRRKKLVTLLIMTYLVLNLIFPTILVRFDFYSDVIYLICFHLPFFIVSILMIKWSSFSSQIHTIGVLLLILNFLLLIFDSQIIPSMFRGFVMFGILVLSFLLLLFVLVARGELIYTRFSTFLGFGLGLLIFQRSVFNVVSYVLFQDMYFTSTTLPLQLIYLLIHLGIYVLYVFSLDAVYQEKISFFD